MRPSMRPKRDDQRCRSPPPPLAVADVPSRRWRAAAAAALLLLLAATPSLAAPTDSENSDDRGRIAQSLFRFPASRLGPHFESVLRVWYEDWLGFRDDDDGAFRPEPSGREFAAGAVGAPSTTVFRRQCYAPPMDRDGGGRLAHLYSKLEHKRKSVEHRLLPVAEEMQKVHMLAKLFHPSFLNPSDGDTRAIHKKSRRQSSGGSAGAEFTTDDGRWTWRPGGQFSSRGAEGRIQFRQAFNAAMGRAFDDMGLSMEQGRNSAMYWYPPGGVREWHLNDLDVTGHPIVQRQVWRMYYVRIAPDDDDQGDGDSGTKGKDTNDRSAMHIVPGTDAGVTPESLRNMGARRLTKDERRRRLDDDFAEAYPTTGTDDADDRDHNGGGDGTFDRRAVWRIPDADGYVSFFRIPEIWHCIVTEDVHRYSLGFAFSDAEVRSLLNFAGVPFDVQEDGNIRNDEF